MAALPFVSRLTPHGRGAVATIRVEGINAADELATLFQPTGNYSVANVEPWRICFGTWNSGSAAGEELVLCRKSESSFDLHCHGGVTIVNAVMDSIVQLGYQQIQWSDIPVDIDDDPWHMEILNALSNASTEKTAAYLARHLDGRWSQEITRLAGLIAESSFDQARQRIEELLSWREFAGHLVLPWKVVIAGKPNVGKSSLINLLLGFERSIVQDQPGTTRDIVDSDTVIDGWPIQLFDTAGQRVTDDEIESTGVQRAINTSQNADLLIWVADVTRPETFEFETENTSAKRLFVANKIDLQTQDFSNQLDDALDVVEVSCKDKTGSDLLVEAIAKSLVNRLPPDDLPLPFAENIVQQLRNFLKNI